MGLTGLASQALAAGYSRTDERGADKEGFNLCVKAGYNPYSMVLTINKLEDLAKEKAIRAMACSAAIRNRKNA